MNTPADKPDLDAFEAWERTAPVLSPYAAYKAGRAQARAELIAELKPVAWMRVHTTPGTPYGPAEHDIDIHVGDDMPNDGRPWTPLALIPDTKE